MNFSISSGYTNINLEDSISKPSEPLISQENNHNHTIIQRQITQVNTFKVAKEDRLMVIKSHIEQLCKKQSATDISFTGEYSCYVMHSIKHRLYKKDIKSLLQLKQEQENPQQYPMSIVNDAAPNTPFKEAAIILFKRLKEEQINYLLLAIKYNADINLIIELLQNSVDPNIYSFNLEESPLTLAISKGKIDVVKILLQCKADPNFIRSPKEPYTPLAIAINEKNVDIVELLINYGATVNARVACNLYTPLVAAIKKKLTGMVKKLITLGADVDGCAIDDNIKPLFYAAKENSIVITKILLEHGADPNKTHNRYSALYVFIKKRNIEAVKLLIKYGVDLNVKHNGITALQQAVANNDFDTARVLRCNLASASGDQIKQIISKFRYDPLGEVSLYELACIIIRRHYKLTNISDWPLPKNRKIDLQEYDI